MTTMLAVPRDYASGLELGMDEWRTWDTLARRVRGRRLMLKLTQQQLAAAGELRQGDISKIERGDILQTTKLVQLARALRCDPLWLATGEGSAAGPLAANEPAPAYLDEREISKGQVFEVLTADELSMLKNFRTLLDDDRAWITAEIDNRAKTADEVFQRALREKLGLQPGKPITKEEAAAIYRRLVEEAETAPRATHKLGK